MNLPESLILRISPAVVHLRKLEEVTYQPSFVWNTTNPQLSPR